MKLRILTIAGSLLAMMISPYAYANYSCMSLINRMSETLSSPMNGRLPYLLDTLGLSLNKGVIAEARTANDLILLKRGSDQNRLLIEYHTGSDWVGRMEESNKVANHLDIQASIKAAALDIDVSNLSFEEPISPHIRSAISVAYNPYSKQYEIRFNLSPEAQARFIEELSFRVNKLRNVEKARELLRNSRKRNISEAEMMASENSGFSKKEDVEKLLGFNVTGHSTYSLGGGWHADHPLLVVEKNHYYLEVDGRVFKEYGRVLPEHQALVKSASSELTAIKAADGLYMVMHTRQVARWGAWYEFKISLFATEEAAQRFIGTHRFADTDLR